MFAYMYTAGDEFRNIHPQLCSGQGLHCSSPHSLIPSSLRCDSPPLRTHYLFHKRRRSWANSWIFFNL